MVLSGIVERVIFQNTENGYTVLDFVADDSTIVTAVGIFPSVREGEALTLVGEFKENSKFGEQFAVTDVTYNSPTDVNGILAYLSSGLFKGVGPSTAAAIVQEFGIKALEVMENTPELLTKVRGIGKAKAVEIAKSYADQVHMQSTIIYLQKLGVTMGQALKIYARYEDSTIEKLEKNPYSLVEDVDGIGFLSADKIAEKLGIDKSSDFRIMAGITHVLSEGSGKGGHSCLPKEMLIAEASKLLETEAEKVDYCLQTMIFNNRIAYRKLTEAPEEGEPSVMIASSVNYNSEAGIAARLVRVEFEAHPIPMDVEKEIGQYEERNGIFLDKTQREAVITAVNSGVMVVTGGPGTGKTTIIKCIIDILTARDMKVLLCAPTGRAAKRMSEATGRDAATIHRLLSMEVEKGKFVFKKNELNPLEGDVIIVDETSMADIYVFYALLKAFPTGARLILVGDKDQLPSVSCGNILSDVIRSKCFPVICLTQIYRQDAESLIVYNAQKINKGEMPEINNHSRDFFLDAKESAKEIADDVVQMISHRISKHFGIPQTEIQVLAPMKKGYAGVENLNALIQNELNPSGKEIKVKDTTFRVGDKVMHTVNNYDLAWEKDDGITEGSGVFNGDIGYILDIDKQGVILVEFEDGKRVRYTGENKDELILAYAVSVHKSQGSEFSAVILALASGGGLILNRNLLYTAVTRAKKLVVIVGTRTTISKMVNNNYTAKRYTLLKELLWVSENKFKTLVGK